MPDVFQLYLFTVASLAVLLIPGPAVFYIVVQSINQGRLAGIIAALGLELGTVFHIGVAAFSISVLMPSSVVIFNILKCFGTAYLIYLGIRTLLSPHVMQRYTPKSNASLKKIFWQGVMVEFLNPKTMIFFFAFLPQFINPAHSNIVSQILILGFLFVCLATSIDMFYAILASSTGRFIRGKKQFVKGQRYVESSVYVGLGLVTALSNSTP